MFSHCLIEILSRQYLFLSFKKDLQHETRLSAPSLGIASRMIDVTEVKESAVADVADVAEGGLEVDSGPVDMG